MVIIYAVIYQYSDGYLGGVGRWLAMFLKRVLLVSEMEIGHEAEEKIVCHGLGDLVARFIRKFRKDKRWTLRVEAVTDGMEADYMYYVTDTDEGIQVQVKGVREEECKVAGVEKIGDYLSAEMSVDQFVEMCGSEGMYV